MQTKNDKMTFDTIQKSINDVTCEHDAKRALMLASIRLLDVENNYYKCDKCNKHFNDLKCCCDECDDDYSCEYCDQIDQRANDLFDDAIDVLVRERRKFVMRELCKM